MDLHKPFLLLLVRRSSDVNLLQFGQSNFLEYKQILGKANTKRPNPIVTSGLFNILHTRAGFGDISSKYILP